MNMTQEELENGFSRQVYLYSGLGFEKMKEIIEKQFPNKKPAPKRCPKCNSESVIMFDSDNDICNECGNLC